MPLAFPAINFPIGLSRCCTQALTQDDRSISSSRNKETPPGSTRLQRQGTGQGGQESVPSVPALALGVVAPAAAAASGRSGRSSSSRRPSSRRSEDSKNGSNRIHPSRNEATAKIDTSNDTNKATLGSAIQRSGVGEDANAGREQQPGVPVGAEADNGGGAVSGPVTGGQGGGGGGSGGQVAAGGTVPVPVKRRVSVQIVAAKIVDKVRSSRWLPT